MEGEYEIRLGSENVGQAVVTQQGLYYRFDCSCKLSGTGIYKIHVSCNGHHESLGVPVPEGDRFRLVTKLAVKKLGKGQLRFQLLPKHHCRDMVFSPVYPEEPFAYLGRLREAVYAVQNGVAGVMLPK